MTLSPVYDWKSYTREGGKDLYKEAIAEGEKLDIQLGGYSATWWAVRFAARMAAGALLSKAREVGVTEEVWEELRKVAADVAYD